MRIFVTGENGNLAQHILGIRGHEFNAASSDKPIPETDVLDFEKLYRSVRDFEPDLIVHTAALVSTERCDRQTEAAIDVNVTGTVNVAKIARRISVPIIHFSSSTIYNPRAYDAYSRSPITIFEDMDVVPETLYGDTKWVGEIVARRITNAGCLVLRPYFIYGGIRDEISFVLRYAKGALRLPPYEDGYVYNVKLSPHYVKDWMHVDDFTYLFENILVAIKHDGFETYDGRVFNVARGDPRKLKYFCDEIDRIVGDKPTVDWRPDEDYFGSHVIDPSAVKAAFNWRPQATFAERIECEIARLQR